MRDRTGARRLLAAASAALATILVLAGCSGPHVREIHLPAVSSAKLAAADQKQLKDAVTAAMAASGSSGAIVGVWAPWSGSWVEGLGVVAPGSKTPVSTDMTFRAGPVTRAMTCDALYTLVDQGRVSLDDPVDAYVSVPSLDGVTLGELCDSTSGIGSYSSQLLASVLNTPGRDWDPHELVSYGLGATADDAKPGARFVSSDAGYVLLGLVLERVTGDSAATVLRNDVFRPLGLTHTALPGSKMAAPTVAGSTPLQGFVAGVGADGAHDCAKPQDLTEMSASFGSTDSGVVSDVDDLGTYVRALASGSLVTAKGRFSSTHPAYAGAPAWYTAAGGAYQAGSLIGQGGSTPGYQTAAFADRKSGLTVVVVLNDSAASGIATDLAWELAAIASKTAATHGKTAPDAGLPFTAQQYHDAIAQAAICGAG